VRAVDRLRLRWIGHRVTAEATVAVDPSLTLAAAHDIAHDAEHALRHAVPHLADATIHAHPA
jgi:divalent metal cation (Fe/Co/Zn/Cd) transporter